MQIQARLNKLYDYVKSKDNQDIPLKAVDISLNIIKQQALNDNQDVSDEDILRQELSKIQDVSLLKRVCKIQRIDYQEFIEGV